MNPLLQVLVAAGWLHGFLPLGFSGGPSLTPRSPAAESIFSCDATQTVVADVDQDGTPDLIAHVDRARPRALRVFVKGSQQIVRAKSACRVGIVDLDHDRDGDLVVLTARGRLHLWRNENGRFHRVRPRRFRSDAVRGAPSIHYSASIGVLLTIGAADPVERSETSVALAITDHFVVRDAPSHRHLARSPYSARPPPGLPIPESR